jgi:hypothetical protein
MQKEKEKIIIMEKNKEGTNFGLEAIEVEKHFESSRRISKISFINHKLKKVNLKMKFQ